MRKISPKKYAISLYESLQGADDKGSLEMIRSFVKLLARNKAINKADKIIRSFQIYANERENIMAVSVITATSLENHVKQEIARHLTKAFGREVEIMESVDPSLLGGLVLKYGDNLIDGSIKKRIALLEESLK